MLESKPLLPPTPDCRRTLAQIVLAAAARRRAATKAVSRRRAAWKERQQRRPSQSAEASADAASVRHSQGTQEKVSTEAEFSAEAFSSSVVDVSGTAGKVDNKAGNTTTSVIMAPATPGVVSLERVVTIDGTEVQLTAQVKELNGGGVEGGGDRSVEMSLVAFDKKTRRSSRLHLEAADIGSIVGAVGDTTSKRGGGGGTGSRVGALEIFSTVLKSLTVFNSRRKELFILSYRGKKVAAPH